MTDDAKNKQSQMGSDKSNQYERSFVWHDLLSSDLNTCEQFYCEVFGWEMKSIERPGLASQFFIYCQDRPVAGVARLADYRHASNRWIPYVMVDNVTATLHKANSCGCTSASHAVPCSGFGTIGAVVDNKGATFAVVEAIPHSKSEKSDIASSSSVFCWEVIITDSPEATKQFYSLVFGWHVRQAPTLADGGYWMFIQNEKEIAGIQANAAANIKPTWLSFIAVTDLSETNTLILKNGGRVLRQPTTIPGIGEFALVQDPLDGVFAIRGTPEV